MPNVHVMMTWHRVVLGVAVAVVVPLGVPLAVRDGVRLGVTVREPVLDRVLVGEDVPLPVRVRESVGVALVDAVHVGVLVTGAVAVAVGVAVVVPLSEPVVDAVAVVVREGVAVVVPLPVENGEVDGGALGDGDAVGDVESGPDGDGESELDDGVGDAVGDACRRRGAAARAMGASISSGSSSSSRRRSDGLGILSPHAPQAVPKRFASQSSISCCWRQLGASSDAACVPARTPLTRVTAHSRRHGRVGAGVSGREAR